ncbi:MAG TPA: ribonuclease Y, partial [Ktedonobacteraceae bacterium]|nr:ribonuclease Y [Ktedonobacteraceae bacterium]
MSNISEVVLIIVALLIGALSAVFFGFYFGLTRNKEKFEESLRAEKEASERRLLEIQNQQHEALRDAREESARFRTT